MREILPEIPERSEEQEEITIVKDEKIPEYGAVINLNSKIKDLKYYRAI